MIDLTYQHKYRVVEEKDQIKRVEYFDEHWYQVEGIWLPSMTYILGEGFPKGEFFEQWLRDVGNESYVIAKKAADSGSKLHNAIEQIIRGGSINMDENVFFDRREWKKLNDWINWFTHYKVRPLACELVVWSLKYKTAGTCDLPCIIGDDVWIIDWKTGNAVYDSSGQQVSGYLTFYNEMIDRKKLDLPKATRAGTVHVGASIKTTKDLNAPGIKLIEYNVDEEMEVFEATKKIFDKRFPNPQPPNVEYSYELKLPESQILAVSEEVG